MINNESIIYFSRLGVIMAELKIPIDPRIVHKIYQVIDIEDYFQRFDAFEELLRDLGYEV